jgi:hypothetical protein
LIESSVAQPNGFPQRTVHTGQDVRYSRGVAIATNSLKEIKKLSPGCYAVPASDPSKAYVVTVRPVVACSCEDSLRRGSEVGPCKHIHAVRYLLRKSGVCSGCGVRHWNGYLTEVMDYHESLSYFEGEQLCPECLWNSDCW